MARPAGTQIHERKVWPGSAYPLVTASAKFARDASGQGVDWDDGLAETWPPGERLPGATAAGLWSGRRTMAGISWAALPDEGQYRAWQAILAAHPEGRVPAGGPAAEERGEARDDG